MKTTSLILGHGFLIPSRSKHHAQFAYVRVLSSWNDQFLLRDARGKYLKKAAFYLCGNRFGERGDQAKGAEYQLEELGDVGELVEKVTLKNGKPLWWTILIITQTWTQLSESTGVLEYLLSFNNVYAMSSRFAVLMFFRCRSPGLVCVKIRIPLWSVRYWKVDANKNSQPHLDIIISSLIDQTLVSTKAEASEIAMQGS